MSEYTSKKSVIIKRNDKSSVKIDVSLRADAENTYWNIEVFTCGAGKRKWLPVYDYDGFDYRKTPMPERPAFRLKKQLSVVSAEELHQAQLLLWDEIKPGE